MNRRLLEKFGYVKVLAIDCDGVMTPLTIETGVIMRREEAEKYDDRQFDFVFESATFSHRDGQGIDLVKRAGVRVVVLTTQRSGYVLARCWKLGIPCLQTKNKLERLTQWLAENYPEVSLDEVCFIGDDVGDIETMKVVGLPITVKDARKEAKSAAVYVTSQKGGDGAVREICDLILAMQDPPAV